MHPAPVLLLLLYSVVARWETNGENWRTSVTKNILVKAFPNVLPLSLAVVCFVVSICVSGFDKDQISAS